MRIALPGILIWLMLASADFLGDGGGRYLHFAQPPPIVPKVADFLGEGGGNEWVWHKKVRSLHRAFSNCNNCGCIGRCRVHFAFWEEIVTSLSVVCVRVLTFPLASFGAFCCCDGFRLQSNTSPAQKDYCLSRVVSILAFAGDARIIPLPFLNRNLCGNAGIYVLSMKCHFGGNGDIKGFVPFLCPSPFFEKSLVFHTFPSMNGWAQHWSPRAVLMSRERCLTSTGWRRVSPKCPRDGDPVRLMSPSVFFKQWLYSHYSRHKQQQWLMPTQAKSGWLSVIRAFFRPTQARLTRLRCFFSSLAWLGIWFRTTQALQPNIVGDCSIGCSSR